MRNYFKSKRGNMLVLVVLLLFVVSVFSVGIISIAATETNLNKADIMRDQAYYVSRSVVETTYEWISKNVHSTDLFSVVPSEPINNEGTNVSHSSGFLEDGKYQYNLEVWRDNANDNVVFIKATTHYDNVQASAVLSFNLQISSYAYFKDAIHTVSGFGKKSEDKNLNWQHTDIYDANVTTSIVIDNPGFDFLDSTGSGSVYKFEYEEPYPFQPIRPDSSIVFTEENTHDSDMDSLDLGADETGIISQNTLILGDLTLSSLLEIDSSGGDIYLYVKGGLFYGNDTGFRQLSDVSGGNIYIIIDGNVNNQGNQGMDIRPPVDYEAMDLADIPSPLTYLVINSRNVNTQGAGNEDDGSLLVAGNYGLYAYIYAPYSVIDLRGQGAQKVVGAIIAERFTTNNKMDFYYKPPIVDQNSPFYYDPDDPSFRTTTNKRWYAD